MSDPTSLLYASKLFEHLRQPDAHPVFVTGAGISLASGISTFRGSDPDAVWENEVLEKATVSYFQRDPAGSWEFYLKRFDAARGAKPNSAHYALAEIERMIPTTTLVTQNIDGLHKDAGSKNLIEVHGSARKMRCARRECVHGAPTGFMLWNESFFQAFREDPCFETIPRCPECRSPIRAHVLWFDETYDSHDDYGMEAALQATFPWTCLVFVGTSHSVGVTYTMLDAADREGIDIFNIDPVGTNYDGILDIKAKSEKVLPTLLKSLGGSLPSV